MFPNKNAASWRVFSTIPLIHLLCSLFDSKFSPNRCKKRQCPRKVGIYRFRRFQSAKQYCALEPEPHSQRVGLMIRRKFEVEFYGLRYGIHWLAKPTWQW